MITIKTNQEIAIMKEGGLILKKIMSDLLPSVSPGISTNVLNQRAEDLIKKYHVSASFKTVKGYRWATCLPVNDQIVHTPPSERILNDGDLLTIDIGICHKAYHTDYAESFVVGRLNNSKIQTQRFLTVGQQALIRGIAAVFAGNRVGDISQAIYDTVTRGGYFVVKNLTGHGIGKNLHEDPLIPGYLDKPVDKTMKLEAGMVLAVEVIYAMGISQMKSEIGNKWSLATQDGSLAACFEKTIVVGQNKAFILT